MQLLYQLDDILECERGMGGRTVQKYVECPLLAPASVLTQPRVGANYTNTNGSNNTNGNGNGSIGNNGNGTSQLSTNGSISNGSISTGSKPSRPRSATATKRPSSNHLFPNNNGSSTSAYANTGSNPNNLPVKFDLRVWVLVTSFDPLGPPKAYVYSGTASATTPSIAPSMHLYYIFIDISFSHPPSSPISLSHPTPLPTSL